MELDHDPIHSGSCLAALLRGVVAAASRGKLVCAILVLFLSVSCQNRDVEAQAEAARAMELLEQNRIAEARIAINRALLLRDDVADFHIARGRIELSAGTNSAAFDAYLDALALDATNREALQAVSQLGLQTGYFRQSLKATDTLVLLNPGDTNALITRGIHSLLSARLDEASEYASRALAVDPDSEEAMILRSRVMYMKGNNQEALDLLAQHSREREPSVGIALMRLELFRAERDPAGMEAQFEALETAGQRTWQLGLDEANFLFKLGRRGEALDLTVDLLASPDLTREASEEAMALWDVWKVTDLPDQALARISAEGAPSARYSVAKYLARQSALSSAGQIAGSLKGDDREAVLALIDLRSGRTSEAARRAAGILERDESHCLALEVQAHGNLAQGKAREALSAAQQLAAQCPGESAGWLVAADAYALLSDPENGRRVLQQGAEANPQDFSYVAEHTQWLREQGRKREALAAARRLTRNSPAMIRGWELYRDLCSNAADPCVADAERGLTDSQTRYWIDYKPGENAPPSLFARLKDI